MGAGLSPSALPPRLWVLSPAGEQGKTQALHEVLTCCVAVGKPHSLSNHFPFCKVRLLSWTKGWNSELLWNYGKNETNHTQLPLKDQEDIRPGPGFFLIRLGNIIYFIKINLVTRRMLKAIYRLFTE